MSTASNPEESEPAANSTISVNKTERPDQSDEAPQAVRELDKDAVFSLLKNQRRRDVLRYLDAHSGEASTGEVAEHVAARENDIPVSQLTSKQRKRVYVALYQCHLPMMADYGVITFNKPRGRIELTPTAAQLEPYLIDSVAETGPWSDYFTVTVFGGLLYLFGGLLVGLDSWFTTITVIGLLVSLTVLALREGRDEIIDAVHTTTFGPLSRGLQVLRSATMSDADHTADDAGTDN